MWNLKAQIKPIGQLLLLGLILFALAPCGAKGSWMEALGAEHARPLNKARTTTGFGSCQYTAGELRIEQGVKEIKFRKGKGSDRNGYQSIPLALPKPTQTNPLDRSDQGPPKYILFKRLRIAALSLRYPKDGFSSVQQNRFK